jgi:4-hydroxybutyryl-CoA dehydratase/vinylacetyl-CoA-Delta-isomerase
LYLHVIERKKDGIVVRDAKAPVSCGSYAHMLSVRGSSKADESEKDYAVGFFIPVDAEGLIHIINSRRHLEVSPLTRKSKY